MLLRIEEDTVGRHDFLLTPCSADTFRILYDDLEPHRGCFGNLAEALATPRGRTRRDPCRVQRLHERCPERRQAACLSVDPPRSRAGDHVTFLAKEDLIIGLTACSAPQSNNGSFKPIHYRIDD